VSERCEAPADLAAAAGGRQVSAVFVSFVVYALALGK
jgi:hypothetical protein